MTQFCDRCGSTTPPERHQFDCPNAPEADVARGLAAERHALGEHDDEAVPGCPTCDELMSDDPELAEQLAQGWSVGEAEARVAHFAGEHLDAPDPDCPVCSEPDPDDPDSTEVKPSWQLAREASPDPSAPCWGIHNFVDGTCTTCGGEAVEGIPVDPAHNYSDPDCRCSTCVLPSRYEDTDSRLARELSLDVAANEAGLVIRHEMGYHRGLAVPGCPSCQPDPEPIASLTVSSTVCAICGRTARGDQHLVDDSPLCTDPLDAAAWAARAKLGFSDETLDEMARDGAYPIGALSRMQASDILMAAADKLEKKSRLNLPNARGLRSIAANLRHGSIPQA